MKLATAIGLFAALIGILSTGTAHATTTPAWAPMNITPAIQLDHTEPFTRVTGWPGQASGPAFYTYVKGSRSYEAGHPEAWYIHQDGRRVRDGTFHSYVMDPSNPGWQAYTARACPQRCYLDGLGTTSLSRTVPHLRWTKQRWIAAVVSELRALRARGIDAAPNSIGLQSAGAYLAETRQASSEAWVAGDRETWPIIGQGRVWVDAHTGRCGQKLAAFLMLRGRGDLFHCAAKGDPPSRIPRALARPRVGEALGAAQRLADGDLRRRFRRATVTLHPDGTYQIRRPA